MADMKNVIEGLHEIDEFIAGRFGFEQAKNFMRTIDEAVVMLKERDNCENCAIAIEDRQPVVRCKDCKWGKQLFPDYISCQISEENESGCHASHRPDWFCADGEKNET